MQFTDKLIRILELEYSYYYSIHNYQHFHMCTNRVLYRKEGAFWEGIEKRIEKTSLYFWLKKEYFFMFL
jgi:hypothetical protein